ncbi:unnamed protein product [Arctia plantaginis]|uniref:Uncharacterized protein n=1 Tax=Arctia plantaginis TaxID=874455 RepID=A0A8S1BB38_ARCPL|nr:unnamed protein product [Arctia plantaginis]
MSFENKVVMVTGAGSGIGAATAIIFAKEGANVVVLDYNEETAKQIGEKCKEFGKKVLVLKTDVSKDEEAKKAFEKTISEFGQLDVLVNNAGIGRTETLFNYMETCDLILNVNLRSVMLMTSLAIPHLIKTKGSIVNVSSIFSTLNRRGLVYYNYAVAKAGVNCFTRLTAKDLAPYGVRVNAVRPGPVYTNILASQGLDTTFDDFVDTTALKRCSQPEEIGDLIVYLASEKAKSVTGSIVDIDAGMSLV